MKKLDSKSLIALCKSGADTEWQKNNLKTRMFNYVNFVGIKWDKTHETMFNDFVLNVGEFEIPKGVYSADLKIKKELQNLQIFNRSHIDIIKKDGLAKEFLKYFFDGFKKFIHQKWTSSLIFSFMENDPMREKFRLMFDQQNLEKGKISINDFVLDYFKQRWDDHKYTVEYLFGLHEKPLVGYHINYTIYDEIVGFANEDFWFLVNNNVIVKFK